MQQDNDKPNDQQGTQAAAGGMAWMNERRPVLTWWEQAENEAAWWDATLDADVFFRRPNIPCEWAALLLCRFNPHHDTREVAEVTNTDETTPNDFKRLLSTFEGRAEAGAEAHSLLDWMAVAAGDGLKTHSWAWSYVAHRFGILGPQSPVSTPEPPPAQVQAKPQEVRLSRAHTSSGLVARARRNAGDDAGIAEIWLELMRMANAQEHPFIGVTDEGLKYQNDKDGVSFINRKSVSDWLRRRR